MLIELNKHEEKVVQRWPFTLQERLEQNLEILIANYFSGWTVLTQIKPDTI